MPYRVAFLDTEFWDALTIIDCFTDLLFFIDIFVNFFSSYMTADNRHEYSAKKIAINYLSS